LPIPRGLPEWGAILYQPEWARGRRFEEGNLFLASYLAAAIGSVPFIIGLATGGFSEMDSPIFLFFGWGVWILGCVGIFFFTHKFMPLRIYEAGFTLPFVPISKGLASEEILIPFGRVKVIDVETTMMEGLEIKFLRLVHEGASGEEEKELLGRGCFDDPLPILLALRKAAPGKLDASLDKYVGTGAESKIISIPSRGRYEMRDIHQVYLLLSMAIFINLAFSVAIASDPVPITWFFLVWTLGIGIGAFMLSLVYILMNGHMGSVIESDGRVEGDRLAYPVPLAYRLFADIRLSLPLREIVAAGKSLDPVSFGHMTNIRTTAGENLKARYEVFAALMRKPGFERNGWELRNIKPEEKPCAPVFRFNPFKTLSILIALMAMQPLAVLLNTLSIFHRIKSISQAHCLPRYSSFLSSPLFSLSLTCSDTWHTTFTCRTRSRKDSRLHPMG